MLGAGCQAKESGRIATRIDERSLRCHVAILFQARVDERDTKSGQLRSEVSRRRERALTSASAGTPAALLRWLALVGFVTLAAACSPSDESVVAVEPVAGGVVDGSAAAAGAGGQGDEFGLQTPSAEEAAPAPPTLSPDAAAETSAVTTPPTAVPTTAAVQPAPSATPATAAAPSQPPAEGATVPPTAVAAAPITADASQLEAGEVHSFTMLNDLRAGLGLPALARDPEMDAFAREWSRQMAESQRFEHSDGPYGENIAFTSNVELAAAEAADAFHQLWVESSEHYANMVNDRYVSAGIGLYLTPNGWYGTHVFKY